MADVRGVSRRAVLAAMAAAPVMTGKRTQVALKPQGNNIVGGTSLAIAQINSPDYVPGVSGWAIFQDGSAEFNNGTFRGQIINGGMYVYSGLPALGNLIASIIAANGNDPSGNDTFGGLVSYGPNGTALASAISQLAAGQLNIGGGFQFQAIGGASPAALTVASAPGSGSSLSLASGQDSSSDVNAFLTLFSRDQNTLHANGLIQTFSDLSLPGLTVIAPSGDTSGVKDTAAINAAIGVAGGAALLLPAQLAGPYIINTPLLPASKSRLWGSWWSRASLNDFYGIAGGASTGTVIQMTTGFTGDAAISMPDPGAGVQNYGVDLCGFTIEGFSVTPGSSVRGIHAVGAWGSCQMRGVTIHRPPSDCFKAEPSSVTHIAPDEWAVSQCAFSGSRAGYGFYASYFDDAWITDCESSANQLDQWYFDHGVNTRLTSCKAEDSQAGTTSNGFRFGGLNAAQCMWLTGCSTHLNLGNGFLFDNTGTGGTGLGTYVLTGCIAQQDASAGFRSTGSLSRIIATGCYAQTDALAAKPLYGAYEGSVSFGMCFTGSRLEGATAATHDDGTNTHALVNQSPVPF